MVVHFDGQFDMVQKHAGDKLLGMYIREFPDWGTLKWGDPP